MPDTSEKRPVVWMINHYAQLPSMPGGTRHYELAKRLAARGLNVTIVASQFHHATRTQSLASKRIETIQGIQFVWIPSRFRYKDNSLARMLNMAEFSIRAWWQGRRRFKTAAVPDIIIGSSPHLLAAGSAACLSKKFGSRFILEIRDLWPESLVALGGYSRRHLLIRCLSLIERWLYRKADHIISLLPEAWRYLELMHVDRKRVTWISNGASALAGSEKQTHSHAKLQAMYIGAHGRANVLDDLLAAAVILQRQDAPVQISLIGDGPRKKALIQTAEREGLRNVEFRDPIAKTQIPATLQEADVAIVLMEASPLYQYGVSLNKLFDSFAAGVPVLFAGDIAHNYVALAEAGLTISPRNPASIVDGLAALATMNSEDRLAMGERGRAYLCAHHEWDLLADRLFHVLDSSANAQQRGAGCDAL